jgi:DNA replication protein DnaC
MRCACSNQFHVHRRNRYSLVTISGQSQVMQMKQQRFDVVSVEEQLLRGRLRYSLLVVDDIKITLQYARG